MEMKRIIRLVVCIFVLSLIGFRPSLAQPCYGQTPIYQFSSDSVDWSIKVGSGRSCSAGFRIRSTVLESIKLVVAPEHGQVTLQGPGFTYKADSGFKGEDSFAVLVSGTLEGAPGSSTIRITVSVF